MIADASTEAIIVALLDTFAAGYAQRDVQKVVALHAADPDVVAFVGGHRHQGLQQIREMVERDLAGFDGIVWEFSALTVSAAGPVAWIATDATATGQTGGLAVPLGAYRCTWVCEQRGEQWLIVHAHVSAVTSEI